MLAFVSCWRVAYDRIHYINAPETLGHVWKRGAQHIPKKKRKSNTWPGLKNLKLWWGADQEAGHLYCVFSPGTRQIASNARFPSGPVSARWYSSSKGSVTATLSTWLFTSSFAIVKGGEEKMYKNVASSKGNTTSYSEVPDEFSSHAPQLPPQYRVILMWLPCCGIHKKSTLIKGRHQPDCLQTPSLGIHTISISRSCAPWIRSGVAPCGEEDMSWDAKISILCGLMHFTTQPSL